LKVLILLLIAFLLYRVIRKLFYANKTVSQDKRNGSINEMVQDPYCKVYIPLRDAHKRLIDNKEYFFCSEECADKFEREISR